MNILIIEDEYLGLERLSKLLRELLPDMNIVGHADSIRSAVHWLQTQPAPDLIFMDIELADGQCFEIFNQVLVEAPVVFTTSYDEYALQAFKVNSIDYLLKPVRKEELERSLDKLRRLQGRPFANSDIQTLVQSMAQQTQGTSLRKRFLVKQGQRLLSVDTEEIAYFAADGKICWLRTWDKHRFLLDYTLDQLSGMLPSDLFFRVNRAYLVHIKAIKSVQAHFNGKLLLTLDPPVDANDVLVSKEKAGALKGWMGK